MELADTIYLYETRRGNGQEDHESKTYILKAIEDNHMAPLYTHLSEKFTWAVNEELLASMRKKNEEDLVSIDAKIEDAAKNAGDTEVIEEMFVKARHFSKIGSWSEAIKVYDEILTKPKTVTGKKIDANMEKAKIHIFNFDTNNMKLTIDEAKRLNEIGGDWDRRNRLKVYEAHYLMSVRDVKQAAKLLLDCVATFTCTEICTYKKFMFYTIVTNIISLDRNDLRKKIVNDPYVITEIRDLPNAQLLIGGIYQCNYKQFFEAIVKIVPDINDDRYLHALSTFLVREFRVLGYSQFLEAYKSVMLSSMAESFGISVELLDAELSRFIAAGRLNAKIDKVGDIVETRRPDKKNAQYHEVIKKGDVLLNQIQKLVRVIDM